MSDEDAFLAAVAAAPADDTPRLVYADWLDDRADPRAEYVRLEVERQRLKPRDKRRPNLTARLDALRPAADPHWLSRIDRVGRHSYFWSRDYYRQMEREGHVGRPLPSVAYHGNGRSWLPKWIATGDYVYVIAWRARTVAVVARMRVAEVVPSEYGHTDRLTGTEGTTVGPGRLLPPEALARMSWYAGKQERRAKLNSEGFLGSFESAARVLRLTPVTATDFDDLLWDG